MSEEKKGLEPQTVQHGFAETRAVHVTGAAIGARRTVTFGNVTVTGPELTLEQRARNAAESTAALSRLKPHLVVPGVRIKRKPGVPLFYANKHRPGTVIREIDDREDVGLLQKDGTFKLIEAAAAE